MESDKVNSMCTEVKYVQNNENRQWKFKVRAITVPGETVCVVGNVKELGRWKSNAAVALCKDISEDDVWSVITSIPKSVDVEFRYFVCVIIDLDDDKTKKMVVRRWETNSKPRIIKKVEGSNLAEGAVIDADTFGLYDGCSMIDSGWLTCETVIQLKLHSNPVQIWKKRFSDKKIHLKVATVNLVRNGSMDVLPTSVEILDESIDTQDNTTQSDIWPLTEVAVMNEENRKFKLQEQFGQLYNDGDFLIFNINVLNRQSVAFLVDFYLSNSIEDEIPVHIGLSYILPSIMKNSEGQLIVPITSTKHKPIGQLTVEYLVVNPIQGYDCEMDVSYSRLWKKSWLGLDVGHRGLGTSFKMHIQSDIRENTIASLKTAASHGADLVEFDVQLTKDWIPVLYHDFHICIAMKRKKQLEDHDMLQLPVKDLTLEQLQLLKVYHLVEGREKSQKFFDEDLEEHQPFPTLKDALELVDKHVGFNVEIKWTMKLKDGSYELYHPFDLNQYLDVVIKVVLQHGGERKIVFSCFHPDVCTMIRLKQNKYPVMFLTQGATAKYPPYHDPRTQSVPMAVHFAVSSGILGINVHTEDLLRDSSLVKLATDAGLIIFCWGEDNNDSNTIKYLKKLGLHAIIYDKIDKYGMKEVKESIFLIESREAQGDILKAVGHELGSFSPSSLTENFPGLPTSSSKINKNNREVEADQVKASMS